MQRRDGVELMSIPRRFYMLISQLGTQSVRNRKPLATFTLYTLSLLFNFLQV
jgi:hypothetical protein